MSLTGEKIPKGWAKSTKRVSGSICAVAGVAPVANALAASAKEYRP